MKPKGLTRPWSKARETRVVFNKMENRPVSDERYHTRRWTRESLAFRSEHPLCAECLKKGIYTPSAVTDHIIPVGHHDFWDRDNWQSLCAKCNIIKGNRDKKKYGKGRGV